MVAHYYADLNPRYGAKGEPRWAVFARDGATGTQTEYSYTSKSAAERSADRLNGLPVRKAILASDAYTFIVVCLEEGHYVLATRTVFASRNAALDYARGMAKGRRAVVIEGDFHKLRVPEGLPA